MNHTRKATLSSLSLLLSTSAFAQYSPSLFTEVFNPPSRAMIEKEFCEGFQGDQNSNLKDIQTAVCKDGVNAAAWMAEKYAVNAGTYLGCVDGFREGFRAAFLDASNPDDKMTQAAKDAYASAKFDSAIARGQQRAIDEGQTVSADQIIKRYRAVINQKDQFGNPVKPDKSYSIPASSFKGFQDGYAYDVLSKNSSYQDIQRLGWVTNKDSFADQVRAQKIYEYQQIPTNNPCPTVQDTIFIRKNVPVLTIWDLWRASDQLNFEKFGWNNASWAWDIYTYNEKNMDQYVSYEKIPQRRKTVSIMEKAKRLKLDATGSPIRKLNPDGTPMVGTDGRPVFEEEEYFTGNIIRQEQPVTSVEGTQLQQIYHKAFLDAYERYYVKEYTSRTYVKTRGEKRSLGETIAKLIGKQAAVDIANSRAYNEQYEKVSYGKFKEKFEAIYVASFKRLVNIFETNSVYELNRISVFGSYPQDGIFRPEELLGLNFSVTNLGEVANETTIAFTSGGLQAIAPAHRFTAPALSIFEDTTQYLARIPGTYSARDRLTLGITVANLGDLNEVAKALTVTKNQPIEIRDYAEIDRIEDELDFVNGNVKLTVSVENPSLIDPSSLNPPVVFKVVTDFGALGQDEKDSIFVGPKSKQKVVLELGRIDPMILLNQGSISGTVSAVLGGKTIHTQKITVSMRERGLPALINYYDALVTGRSDNSGRESKQDRIARLGTEIVEALGNQIEDINVLWKRDHGRRAYDLTIVYALVQKYQESKRAGRIVGEAQDIYERLVDSMIRTNIRKIRAGGGLRFFFGPNRRNFIYRLQEIAPNISERPRDWY